jgi:hypothetical protein
MTSLFSVSSPVTVFQVWFVVYVYLLPVLLYAAWTGLSLIDLAESGGASAVAWTITVLLLPFVGGAAYLLFRARTLGKPLRYAAVVAGAIAALVPLTAALWLAGGPLGPKALS